MALEVSEDPKFASRVALRVPSLHLPHIVGILSVRGGLFRTTRRDQTEDSWS